MDYHPPEVIQGRIPKLREVLAMCRQETLRPGRTVYKVDSAISGEASWHTTATSALTEFRRAVTDFPEDTVFMVAYEVRRFRHGKQLWVSMLGATGWALKTCRIANYDGDEPA